MKLLQLMVLVAVLGVMAPAMSPLECGGMGDDDDDDDDMGEPVVFAPLNADGVVADVDAVLDADTSQVGSFGARFAGVVFPGETLRVSIWRDAARYVAVVTVPARENVVVLSGVELIPV